MNITLNEYISELNNIIDEIKDSTIIPKKAKKTLKKLSKRLSKVDEKMFQFILDVSLNILIANMVKNKDISGIYETMDAIKNILSEFGINLDDQDYDYEIDDPENFMNVIRFNGRRDKRVLKPLDESDGLITNNPDISISDEFKDMKWAMESPMKLTIASNGSIWMNESLWDHLYDIIIHEAFSNVPLLAVQNKPISKITLNLGYNKNKILLSFSRGVSRCMKLTFTKNKDKNGKIYATIDDDTSRRFAIETSFNVKGEYIIKPTTLFGVLEGTKKTDSMNAEFTY